MRLVENSQVVAEPSLEFSAACHAISDAYFCLLPEESTVLNGGMSLILVPSGKFLEEDPTHFDSFVLAS